VKDVVRIVGRDPSLPGGGHGLQPGAYANDGAVVVGSLDVDGAGVAAFPLAEMVGDVGTKYV